MHFQFLTVFTQTRYLRDANMNRLKGAYRSSGPGGQERGDVELLDTLGRGY